MDKEKTELIDPKLIVRDIYQPRLNFSGIKELAENISEEQQYDAVHVDANNILIDGERRWRAALEAGKLLEVKRHPEVSTVEQRDHIRDVLAEHRKEISIVERAWNYARRVVKINSGRDYTPQQLMDLKKTDYQNLGSIIIKQPVKGEFSGFYELARQLGSNKPENDRVNLQRHTMLVFLSSGMLDRLENGEINYSLIRDVPRLYEHPKELALAEKLVLDLKMTTNEQVNKYVTDTLAELDRRAEEEAGGGFGCWG